MDSRRTAGLAAVAIAVIVGLFLAYRSIGNGKSEATAASSDGTSSPDVATAPVSLEPASNGGSRSEVAPQASAEVGSHPRASERETAPSPEVPSGVGTATLLVNVLEKRTHAPMKG